MSHAPGESLEPYLDDLAARLPLRVVEDRPAFLLGSYRSILLEKVDDAAAVHVKATDSGRTVARSFRGPGLIAAGGEQRFFRLNTELAAD